MKERYLKILGSFEGIQRRTDDISKRVADQTEAVSMNG